MSSHERLKKIKANRVFINTICYADDTTFIVDNVDDLRDLEMVDGEQMVSASMGLEEKTKLNR